MPIRTAKFRVLPQCLGNLERTARRLFRAVTKDQRHPVAGRQPNELFVGRVAHLRRPEHDFRQLPRGARSVLRSGASSNRRCRGRGRGQSQTSNRRIARAAWLLLSRTGGLANLFRCKGLHDFFEAGIATERVPEGEELQFSIVEVWPMEERGARELFRGAVVSPSFSLGE